jgi:hypothetical protein
MSIVRIWTILRTIQCKIERKYGVILKRFLEGEMKNFVFLNRVLERRVLEREYCIRYIIQEKLVFLFQSSQLKLTVFE